MKAIAKLKDDARRHEQKEEWEKAITAYLQVLRLADQGDAIDLDLPLYNRVGDLYVRLGLERDAVKYYEQAADRYAEAGLYNNAIALCNKALRYDEGRLELLKKLGSYSASQGFFTDARRWYLEYAEKSIKLGAVDEAFSALTDLAQVSDDPEIRELLAGQLRDHGRTQQAVEQYKRAYSMRVAAGQVSEANAIRARIERLDPGADMSVAAKIPMPDHPAPARHKEEELPGFVDHAPPAAAAPVTVEPELQIVEPKPEILEPEPEILEPDLGMVEAELETFEAEREKLGHELETLEPESVLFESEPETFEFEPPTLVPEPEIQTELVGLDDFSLEVFGQTEDVDTTAEHGAFDFSLDYQQPAGPMEVEEEHELFDLTTFGALGGAAEVGEELPLLREEPELDGLEDLEPLPGLDMIETTEALRGMEEGDVSALDIGEIDREDRDLEGAPLPMMEVDLPDDTSPVDAEFVPDSELEYWTQPKFVPPTLPADYREADPEPKVEAEPEFEAASEREPEPEWEVETVPRFEAASHFEFADAADVEPELESEIEIDEDIETPYATEPHIEVESAAEADPYIEIEPYVDEPEVEAEPPVVAQPPAEAEPYVEAELDDVWAEFEVERPSGPEPALGTREGAEPWDWEDVEPEMEAEADLELPLEFEREPRAVIEAASQQATEPETPTVFENASVVEPIEAEPPPPKTAEPKYVDLAALLGEDDEEATDSTRFVVAERPPTGDEEKDFADMLQQFKQKVAETIPREDAGSHYDLGLAFKEMGLIDEAIGEFQTALRSGQEKLKVYEELGSCFVMKQQYSVAISVLNRAQQMPFADESDLLGVYYNLGRAHEELGQRAEAKSAYEWIIAIDIGFQDTSARLARL
jgi:tetratricopeptide (TPR) repeat protein